MLPEPLQLCLCYHVSMAKILIRKVMEEKNIKPARLQPFLTMSRSTMYNVLNGTKSPTLDELEEFAIALNVTMEELYEPERAKKSRL